MNLLPDALHQLPLPAMPAVLERAFGYQRDARFVLFHWEPAGDELIWSDGQVSTVGEWSSFLLFLRHPKTIWALEDYFFGASDAPAQDGLVLDRATRNLYAGPLPVAQRFVREQHGPVVPLAEWARMEGITVEEAEARQRQAIAVWLEKIHAQQIDMAADSQVAQADIAERRRIMSANEALLQAALDAMPEVELPVPPPGVSACQIRCGLCHNQIGPVPQLVEAIPELVKSHLLGTHHLTRLQWASATWQAQPDGRKQWAQDEQVLVVIDPPHIWIQSEDGEDDSLEARVTHTMIDLCRREHPALFDELALGIWCGITRGQLLQRVRQIAGTTQSLTMSMVEYTLDALVRKYRNWQEWHVADQA